MYAGDGYAGRLLHIGRICIMSVTQCRKILYKCRTGFHLATNTDAEFLSALFDGHAGQLVKWKIISMLLYDVIWKVESTRLTSRKQITYCMCTFDQNDKWQALCNCNFFFETRRCATVYNDKDMAILIVLYFH